MTRFSRADPRNHEIDEIRARRRKPTGFFFGGVPKTEMSTKRDLIVLHEHPEWQEPLFEALRRRGVDYAPFDLKAAVFSDREVPAAALYFNQASPSAYLRGNQRAVPLALALLEDLERRELPVINGASAFRLELSKASQIFLMRSLAINHPRTWVFNDFEALATREGELVFPAILKPNQGGSGARMFRVDSLDELGGLLRRIPHIWQPEGLMLLQEFLPHDREQEGIVRMEFLDGRLLYAMRVASEGGFNLCPSEICNPEVGGDTGVHAGGKDRPPRFHPYPEVPTAAVRAGQALVRAARIDVGAVEYLETPDGRRVFYDVNANSNLRRSIGEAHGFDPFERVVDLLTARLKALGRAA